jgi:hypothetical protein
MKGNNVGKASQQAVHRSPQHTAAFSMNDANLPYALIPAGPKVFGNQVLDLPRVEGVQVQDPVYGEVLWSEIFHRLNQKEGEPVGYQKPLNCRQQAMTG